MTGTLGMAAAVRLGRISAIAAAVHELLVVPGELVP